MWNRHLHELLEAFIREQQQTNRELSQLYYLLAARLPQPETITYTAVLRGNMSIQQTSTGGTGTFLAQLLGNGAVLSPQPTLTWAYTADDTSATLTPSADTTQVVANIPAGDASTVINLTAATTAPDGTAVTVTLAVPVLPVAQTITFTAQLTQTS